MDGNDSMSTPPSVLRREILQLDDELIETHDFHDLEIKILREENEISGNLKNVSSTNPYIILKFLCVTTAFSYQ